MGNTELSWSVYMVQCADNTLYTGIAKDVSSRIEQHNAGKGAKYTRARGPVALLYCESGLAHGDALRREMAIKRLSALEKRELIASAEETSWTEPLSRRQATPS